MPDDLRNLQTHCSACGAELSIPPLRFRDLLVYEQVCECRHLYRTFFPTQAHLEAQELHDCPETPAT